MNISPNEIGFHAWLFSQFTTRNLKTLFRSGLLDIIGESETEIAFKDDTSESSVWDIIDTILSCFNVNFDKNAWTNDVLVNRLKKKL